MARLRNSAREADAQQEQPNGASLIASAPLGDSGNFFVDVYEISKFSALRPVTAQSSRLSRSKSELCGVMPNCNGGVEQARIEQSCLGTQNTG